MTPNSDLNFKKCCENKKIKVWYFNSFFYEWNSCLESIVLGYSEKRQFALKSNFDNTQFLYHEKIVCRAVKCKAIINLHYDYNRKKFLKSCVLPFFNAQSGPILLRVGLLEIFRLVSNKLQLSKLI